MTNSIHDEIESNPKSRKRAIQRILFTYLLFVLPALIWHEKHLPIFYIIILTLLTLFLGIILFFISIKILENILKEGFHPIYEFVVYSILFFALALSGFLDDRAGIVFIFIFIVIVALFRFIKLKLHYGLSILAMLLLSNALLTFVSLQKMEIFTAYYLFRNQVQFTEVDLSGWEYKEETRILSNLSIPIELKIPEEMFFHNPQDLGLKDKTGIGQIAGIISSSDHDPNSYPFARIFFFPAYVEIEEKLVRDEVWKYIQLLINQGEIEEVNEIQPNLDFKIFKSTPFNNFWTFYDIIRPRYAKTGFYYFQLPNGNKLLIHITENLEKGQYHETKIQSLLNSIQFK